MSCLVPGTYSVRVYIAIMLYYRCSVLPLGITRVLVVAVVTPSTTRFAGFAARLFFLIDSRVMFVLFLVLCRANSYPVRLTFHVLGRFMLPYFVSSTFDVPCSWTALFTVLTFLFLVVSKLCVTTSRKNFLRLSTMW